jgi:UPF0271 protein
VPKAIDLNADLGEGFGAYALGEDRRVLAEVTSANIACGFHAGDPLTMDRTVALCLERGVALGAHPGYHDLRGFGRREIQADPREVEADVLYQIGALRAIALSRGATLVHVKPHGALYTQAATDPLLAQAIARGIARAGGDLVFVGLSSSLVMREAARNEGLRFAAEAFADRRYRNDGSLVPRSVPGAVLHDSAEVASQAVSIVRDGFVTADDGSRVALVPETLCLHGDTPEAVAHAQAVRGALAQAGVRLAPLAR